MAKLYFRYGAVSSAKTLSLLAVAHNYRKQGKRVVLMKPAIDTRFGQLTIRSRAGLEADVNVSIVDEKSIDTDFTGVSCVLVDEAQFLSPASIEALRHVTIKHNVPVICYGLRTDFRRQLFAGSKRLLELADSIEEVKTTCNFCNRKAIFSLKRDAEGKATLDGEAVELGDDMYVPACAACYEIELS
jgi:thymidine kinase